MYRVRQQDLPFQSSSHQFVGADYGDVGVAVYLLSALRGRGPGRNYPPSGSGGLALHAGAPRFVPPAADVILCQESGARRTGGPAVTNAIAERSNDAS